MNALREKLTPRQYEVLLQLVEGKCNKEIGRALWITEDTVKNHINHICARLGTKDRLEIVVLYYKARVHELEAEVQKHAG